LGGPEEKARLLSLTDILEPLSRREVEELGRRLQDVALERGEVLYSPGQRSEALFILRRGRMRVYRMVGSRELTLAVVREGTVFGEIPLTAQRVHGSFAEAAEPSEISVLGRDDLKELILSHPEVGLRLVELLGERLGTQEERLAEIALKDVPSRLASSILRLVEGEGVVKGGVYEVATPYTHRELAAMIGANREAVTNALGDLRRAGMIEVRRRRIRVKDLPALGRVAGWLPQDLP